MSIIRRHTYSSRGQITAQARDGDYLWIAYDESSTTCKLYKVSVFDPTLRFFSVTVTAEKINRLHVSGSYLYCAFDDSTYIGARFSTSNPLATYDYIAIPSGITEEAVDVGVGSTYWYLLTPGILSGENAKVIVINDDTYSETISLTS